MFFRYLSRHLHLLEDGVAVEFFRRECTRAWAGIVLYAVAGVLGILAAPLAGLVVFLILTVLYGVTSQGLADLRYPKNRILTKR